MAYFLGPIIRCCPKDNQNHRLSRWYAPCLQGIVLAASQDALNGLTTWIYTTKVDKWCIIIDKHKRRRENADKEDTVQPRVQKTLVTLYQSGKTYAQIKNEYRVSSSTLSAWIHQFSEVKIDDETILTAKQIKELQKRNAQLEEENLILKKRLQSSRHTQAKNKGHSRAGEPTQNRCIVSGAAGQSQHLLQANTRCFEPSRCGKQYAEKADFKHLRQVLQTPWRSKNRRLPSA